MKPLSYKIHLPTGTVITAKNEQELKNILNMNVCRIHNPDEIKIETLHEVHPANTAIRQTTNKLRVALKRHELDCDCADCQRV